MTRYSYKAINGEGETYTDTMEVESREELLSTLKVKGHTFVTAEESQKKKGLKWVEDLSAKIESVKDEQKVMFARNLSAMLEAGLALGRALTVMERQTKNKKLKKVLNGVSTHVSSGSTLSSGLAKYPKIFSPLFVSMVRAGEESGNLASSLSEVGLQMDAAYKLKKKVKGAMMYPAIIMIAMIVIGILMLIFVVPTLTSTFTELNVDLPASTQFIIGLSNFLKNNTIIALSLIVVLIGSTLVFRKTDLGKKVFGKIAVKLPLIGELVRETNAARTANTLASLLTSGVEVVRALEITEDVLQNVHYKKVLKETREVVQKGTVMSAVFKKYEDLYPPFVSEMLAVGEETGQLAELLGRVGAFYQEDVEQRTKDMSTIIEPFLMVVIGVVVGFFAVSMITPMYSLTSSI